MQKTETINNDELFSFFNGEIDLLICSSSFDDRCLNISKSIESISKNKVGICHFENNYNKSIENLEALNSLNSKSKILKTIEIKKNNPIYNFDLFREEFCDPVQSNGGKVVVDITTFTRENLLILLRFFSLYYNDSMQIYLCYTPSKNYPKWLSRGVREIRSILGYSGEFSALKDHMLIVLSGFEYERVQTLIEIYEPTKLLLGKANPDNSILNELAEINESNFNKLLSMNPHAEIFEFSCKDIQTTKSKLVELSNRYESEFNIVVAPMNNKLSTLAVAFAAIDNQNIQVCYASTNQYNIEEEHEKMPYVFIVELKDHIKFNNI
jgi:hypothetical protein